MDKLIGVINELHDVFSEVKMDVRINLPQIAVVGSQSCGKSSVLESIVGKDFLPRGSGIVTRCPLVLQLVQLPKNNEEEWGEFLHIPNKKFFDFQEIQNEITRRTNEVAGPASITSKAINLKVFSNKVLNLTLVDLPGLVMNAVGDQPKDIDRQIKNMVVDYVSPKNTIILAISPANTDLATSQSLRLASQLDPNGERTVGVLTKVDLMDRGTDCFDILSNKVLPLRHGFVGVVCRCQQDINDSKSMEAAREAEHEFFASSTAYSSIADQSGTVFLTRKLNGLLLAHIKEVIPDLRSKVESIMEKTSKQMEKLGMGEAEVEPGAKLLSLIKVFSDSVNQTIDGGITDATRELLGGARLEYIFNELFAPHIMSLSAKNDLTDEYIRVNSRNMSGMHATVFPSDQVFVALSKQQISRLEQPSGKCVTFIYDELLKIIDTCSMKLARFPQLKSAAVSICQHMLNEMNQPTANHVRLIISAERGFINVKHPSMKLYLNVLGGPESKKGTENHTNPENSAVGNGAAIPADAKEPANNKQGGSDVLLKSMEDVPNRILLGSHVTPHEQTMNNAIREMVESYFEIVKGNVADQVPKAITLLMIRRLGEDMYSRLVKELYSDTKAKDLLSEHPDIEDQRKAVTSMMTALQKAHTALNNVRDFRLPN